MAVRGWDLDADWSRQGHFTGPLEDVTSYVQGGQDITVSYGADISDQTTRITSGSMTVALNNLNRQFSPENAASPIAGKVWPGTTMRLNREHLGQLYTLFSGPIDKLNVDPNSAAKTFSATALDAWGQPGAEILSTTVYTGQRTGYLINVILDAIGWTGPREIDPGVTYVAYWWEEGTDAATAVQKLVDSEGPSSCAFVRGGTFVFHDRHHRLLAAASQTSQGTFTHIVPTFGLPVPGDHKILKNTFSYDHGLDRIANAVSFEVEQRRVGAVESIWSTEDTFALGANEVVSLQIQANNPFINAAVPRAGIEYVLLSGGVTISLSRTSGAALTLTLTAGGAGAFVVGMSVLANPIVVARTIKVTQEDAGSIQRSGRQTWGGTVPWANAYDADVIAQKIVALYASNRPVVRFTVANVSTATATQQVRRQPSDRIRVRNDAMALDAEFVIERITHVIRKLRIHYTTFECQLVEPSQPATVFTFDTAGKGSDQGSFGINGVDTPSQMFLFDVAGRGFDQGKFAS